MVSVIVALSAGHDSVLRRHRIVAYIIQKLHDGDGVDWKLP